MIYLVYPIPGAQVTGRFGETGGAYGTQPHRGVDFSAVVGTPVRAAYDGQVQNAEGQREGRCVWLRAGQVVTFYAHLSQQTRQPGERVLAGEVIALSGSSGLCTAPHLHFGLRLAADWVDPAPCIRPVPDDEQGDLATLAEKARWWHEEFLRLEKWEYTWATVVKRSLTRLLYRVEAMAKADPGASGRHEGR
jgi:murein DD-endopeptidase MepM/ murein hydrolase activator NlpD